jgi:transketolase
MSAKLDQLCVNTIRTLAMDGVQKAKSGHPGMPMGMADAAYVLWTRFLKHNPANPDWTNRDRFVLSAGHGSMLLYSLLYLTGYDLPLEELKSFRQWSSLTPGHPEYDLARGVETTTGPLGQGFATGVGMAIAQAFLAATFNKPDVAIFDHFVYAICSDGDLMEGVSHEAASLAGHLGLGRIIYLYDDNEISIEGSTDLAFTEDVPARFRAYNWHVQEVDGHDRDQVEAAIRVAQLETERPSLIVCHTHIAYGSPNKQDTAASHGAPLGEEEVQLTKEALDWSYKRPFTVPKQALEVFRQAVDQGRGAEAEWDKLFERYKKAYPKEAALLEALWAGDLPEGWTDALPTFTPDDGPLATRKASGAVLNAIASKLPTLIGGSADLAPSTKTLLEGYDDFEKETPAGRNLRFGVREHTMGAILNGMALYGGLLPYGATFFVFSDYMRPAVRLAALMEQPVIYVWTHDSVWIGEDGPTHQPIEHLAAVRAIPNMADTVARGAYVLADSSGIPSLILIATGSEVSVALGARDLLAEKGIAVRVVSMPSWELFEAQSDEYKASVLPPQVTARLAIEAGVSLGWHKYIGPQGDVMSLERFGASAPYKVLMQEWGFTPEAVAERAMKLLE